MLKETAPEAWVNNGGTDFSVQLRAPSQVDLVDKVLVAEGTYSHWSLFNRFILVNDVLDAADAAGTCHQLLQRYYYYQLANIMRCTCRPRGDGPHSCVA